MAFSNDDESQTDIQSKARHAVALAESIDWSRIPKGRVINVNYPKGPLSKNRGLRVCRQTTAVWKNDYLERRDPAAAATGGSWAKSLRKPSTPDQTRISFPAASSP